MDSSMERSMDSSREEHRGHDDHHSVEYNRSPGHRRSMSEPRQREIIINLPGYLKRDQMGVVWRKHAVICEDLLPKNEATRDYIATRLTDLGYGERETFKDVQTFVLSLKRLARADDLDFVLDSNVWNFILGSWVKDSKLGGKFDFGLGVNVHNCLLRRRAGLLRDSGWNIETDEYGRELLRG